MMRLSKMKENNLKIPEINRDGPLLNRLLVVVIGGFDGDLDNESKLYLRLLCRLVDKCFDDYVLVKELIDKEIKIDDKLAFRFQIINHLENCINSIARVSGVIFYLQKKSDFKLLKSIDKGLMEVINLSFSRKLRGMVEHIHKDIYEGKFKEGLFLDIDEKYEKICINEECVEVLDLSSVIYKYHVFVSEVLNCLPSRIENGRYYYSKR